MPAPSDKPLRKVTLNLYAEDVEWFEKEYGPGWSERIRQAINMWRVQRELGKLSIEERFKIRSPDDGK